MGRDAKVKTADSAWSPLAKGLSLPGRVGCPEAAGLQGNKSSNIPGVSLLKPCMSWVDLDESLWSWLERRLHLALSHFQGSQERDKVYNHLDPLSPLKQGK